MNRTQFGRVATAILIGMMSPIFVLAQSDLPPFQEGESSAMPASSSGVATPARGAAVPVAEPATSVPAASGASTAAAPRATSSVDTSSGTSRPPASALLPKPAPDVPTRGESTTTVPVTDEALPVESNFGLLALAALAVALAVGGYAASRALKKKKTPDAHPDRCGAIKNVLDAKKSALAAAEQGFSLQRAIVEELKKKIESHAQSVRDEYAGKIKEEIREKVLSEKASQAVVIAEDLKETYEDIEGTYKNAQKVFEDLKKVYEGLHSELAKLESAYTACTAGADVARTFQDLAEDIELPDGGQESLYKGTIVENSLSDTTLLEKVSVVKTYQSGDWILHDVLVTEKQIAELSRYLADGPWYIDLRKPKEATIVVFKNKTFTICRGDKAAWVEAVAYGKSIGIPEEQLDFFRA